MSIVSHAFSADETVVLHVTADTTTSQIVERATELLIDRLQRPLEVVLVDTVETGPDYFAFVEARAIDNGDTRTEFADVLSRAYRGERAA